MKRFLLIIGMFVLASAGQAASAPQERGEVTFGESGLPFRPFDKDLNGKPLPCYQCLVPQAPRIEGQTCAEVGILGTIAGVMGTMQATEVIKEILGVGDSLAGKLILYNGLEASFKTIKLPKDPGCPCCSRG